MERESWRGRKGLVFAAMGSAIGLGNIWMFPYQAGAHGGGAFLISYLIIVAILGFTGVMMEFGLGRSQRGGAPVAFKKAGLVFGQELGYLAILVLFGTFAFYVVVIGWVLRYFMSALTGAFWLVDASTHWEEFVWGRETVFWTFLAVAITVGIVLCGVRRGIERACMVLMPALFLLLLILVVRALTLPNAVEGLKFYLVPDWAMLVKPATWGVALAQAFFSLSIFGSILVVYGSYTEEREDIPRAAIHTVIGDTAAAFLAGLMILPAVFAFGLDPAKGPGLLFITMPQIFRAMPGGYFFAIIFFALIIFAALTSSISILEGPVEALMTRFGISRKKATLGVGLAGFLCAVPLLTYA